MSHKPIFTTVQFWETNKEYNNRIAKACTLIDESVVNILHCDRIWIDNKLQDEMGYDLICQIGGHPKFTSEMYKHFPCLVIDMNNKKRECIVYVGKDKRYENTKTEGLDKYHIIRLASDKPPTDKEFKNIKFFRKSYN